MNRSPVRTSMLLGVGAAAGVGIARFGFGPVLPAMRDDLGWSLSTAGAMQSVNLAGYVCGSLLASSLSRRWETRRVFGLAYIGVAAGLILTGLASGVVSHVLLRFLTGFGSAQLWILGGVLVSRLAEKGNSGLIIGVFFGGMGTGMIATGALLPLTFSTDNGWRYMWIICGVGVAGLAPLVVQALRVMSAVAPGVAARGMFTELRLGDGLRPIELSYFLFGLGSIGYMTFVIALLKEQGTTANGLGVFWAVFGVSIWVATRIWATAIGRSDSGALAARMYLIMTLAALATILGHQHLTILLASAIGFGSVFVSAVAATTHLIRTHLPPESWTATLARFTVGYGLALTVGAAATGTLSERYSLSVGLATSTALLFLAAIAASRQTSPDHAEPN